MRLAKVSVALFVLLFQLVVGKDLLSEEYKGWDYLVSKLRERAVSQRELDTIFKNPLMPPFENIPFAAAPREHHSLYQGFATKKTFQLSADFIRRNFDTFEEVRKTLGVPQDVIASILFIESHLGKNAGKEMVIYRLARISSVGEPDNIAWNYRRLKRDDPELKLEKIKLRAKYLENAFIPEILGLIRICSENRLDIFSIRGSSAGAFGMPQFLPTTFLRFARDGNRDGLVSLYQEKDAIWSIATFLANFGFKAGSPLAAKRAALWHYNKSDAYIDTVLKVSLGINRQFNAE